MVTHNIGGASKKAKIDSITGADISATAADFAMNRIEIAKADAAALQEVCEYHLPFIAARLQASYHIYFDREKLQTRCPGAGAQQWHGNVILVSRKHPFVRAWSPSIYEQTSTQYDMACIQSEKKGPFIACSVHLPNVMPDGVTRRQMTTKIASHMSNWRNQQFRVVVAGDFNARPDVNAIDEVMYPKFWEADPSRTPTHQNADGPNGDGKIDYIFFTRNFGQGTSAKVFPETGFPVTSDHRVLRGTAPMPN